MKISTICRSCDGVIRFTRVQPKKLKAIEDTTLDLDDSTVIIGAKGLGKGSVLQSLHWMLRRRPTLECDRVRKAGGPYPNTTPFRCQLGSIGTPGTDLSTETRLARRNSE